MLWDTISLFFIPVITFPIHVKAQYKNGHNTGLQSKNTGTKRHWGGEKKKGIFDWQFAYIMNMTML